MLVSSAEAKASIRMINLPDRWREGCRTILEQSKLSAAYKAASQYVSMMAQHGVTINKGDKRNSKFFALYILIVKELEVNTHFFKPGMASKTLACRRNIHRSITQRQIQAPVPVCQLPYALATLHAVNLMQRSHIEHS